MTSIQYFGNNDEYPILWELGSISNILEIRTNIQYSGNKDKYAIFWKYGQISNVIETMKSKMKTLGMEQ